MAVVKVIEILAESDKSWEDATKIETIETIGVRSSHLTLTSNVKCEDLTL